MVFDNKEYSGSAKRGGLTSRAVDESTCAPSTSKLPEPSPVPPTPGGSCAPELAASHLEHHDEAGRVWVAGLPDLAASYVDRWRLRLDGPPRYCLVSMVLPVLCADGTAAALKLQPVDEENAGEAA